MFVLNLKKKIHLPISGTCLSTKPDIIGSICMLEREELPWEYWEPLLIDFLYAFDENKQRKRYPKPEIVETFYIMRYRDKRQLL